MPNPVKVSQSKVFRDRAEECRTMAALFHREKTRALLFRVAADYARLADQAAIFELQDADREAGIIPPGIGGHSIVLEGSIDRRVAAGAFGFLIFSHAFDGPDL